MIPKELYGRTVKVFLYGIRENDFRITSLIGTLEKEEEGFVYFKDAQLVGEAPEWYYGREPGVIGGGNNLYWYSKSHVKHEDLYIIRSGSIESIRILDKMVQ